HWGAPMMGAEGAAWSTLFARVLMFVALAVVTWIREPAFKKALRDLGPKAARIEPKLLLELLGLGLPAGLHFLFEVGAFSLASTLAARLGKEAMGAHHAVLQIASFTFMFPLGVSVAASVRVGNAVGAGHVERAKRLGWTGIALGAGIMAVSAVVLLAAGHTIVGWFSPDEAVRTLGSKVLLVAAFFQIFDGIQVAGAGALRGWGDTRTPMVANALGHYPIGLALALYLCFTRHMGIFGLWIGLATGLAAVAFMCTWKWARATTPEAHASSVSEAGASATQ
ncbi:MAG TPA: MATE family efflux transporter, partial [Bdellovibrionota bacterium]|nr:MATE family efflux transporter [Bdellovibrionota bacterium]